MFERVPTTLAFGHTAFNRPWQRTSSFSSELSGAINFEITFSGPRRASRNPF